MPLECSDRALLSVSLESIDIQSYQSSFRERNEQVESQEVYVKAHIRVVKQKVYRFVCKECNQVVERICYPSLPLYCLECRPPKPKKQKPSLKFIKSKKKPKTKQPVSVNDDMEVVVGQ